MNELTEKLVIETAKKYRKEAKRNDSDFRHLVESAHWEHCLVTFGWQLKQRAVDLFRLWHPEMYDGEFIQDYTRIGFDLDLQLSKRVTRIIARKIARDPELELQYGWQDLPERIADPQIAMF